MILSRSLSLSSELKSVKWLHLLFFHVTLLCVYRVADTNDNKMCNLTWGFILNSVVLLTKNMPVLPRVKRHNRGVTSAGTLVCPNSLWSMIVLIHCPISAPPLIQMQCQKQHFPNFKEDIQILSPFLPPWFCECTPILSPCFFT